MTSRRSQRDRADTVESRAFVQDSRTGVLREGATPIVVAFLLTLTLIPPVLVVPGLGAAGRPAALIALGLLGWWALSCTLPRTQPAVSVALRWAFYVHLMVFIAAMVAGLDRGLPGVEARSMDRTFLLALGFTGISLAIIDGLPTRRAIDRLLWWTVSLGAIGALVGVVQFAVDFDVTVYIDVPGLQSNSELSDIRTRGLGDLRRVRGFAVHAIEFGVVLATLLPVAIHLASTSTQKSLVRWLPAVAIGLAIPLSISRSASLALIIGMSVFALSWTWRQRGNAFAVAAIGVVAFQTVVPGLLGTIRSLFRNTGNDDTVTGRTEDYAAVGSFIRDRPWLGRGPGTFTPEEYRLLDNQYLKTLLEQGWLGLLALIGLMSVAGLTAMHLARSANDPITRSLASALGAGVAIAFVVFATFDALFFPIYTGVLFVVIGCIGALYRLDAIARQTTSVTELEPSEGNPNEDARV